VSKIRKINSEVYDNNTSLSYITRLGGQRSVEQPIGVEVRLVNRVTFAITIYAVAATASQAPFRHEPGRNTRRRRGIRFSSIVENAFSRAAVTLLAGTEVSCTAKIIRYVLARWRSFTVRRPADDVFNCSAVTWPSVSSKFHGREFTTSTAHYRIARRRARVHTIHKYTHTPTTLTSNFSVRNVVVIHSLLIPRYRVEAFLF